MQRLIFAFALVACGGTSAPPTDPSTVAKPAADPAPCEDAATNAVKFLDKAKPADRVKATMVSHCTADSWSVDTRKCLLTAKSIDELDPCAKTLTPAQETAFKQELDALDAGSGAPATPPTNTPPSNIPPPAGSMPTR